ncbi:MAG: peptidoglycan-binding protein LysM [Lysobacteraceae bacterium]
MGVFDFVKSAGEKLFGFGKDNNEALTDHVKKYELGKDLKIESDAGKVKVSGTARTQEEKEKILLALGNVEGVEQVEDIIFIDPSVDGPVPMPPSPQDLVIAQAPAPEPQFYTVKKGDNLSKVSKQYYGTPNKYNIIFEANRPMLSHPDKIYPGQVLRIPPLEPKPVKV